ncbi:MAG: outer membrane beta-barrel protein, partial [Gammaproteobacteria bacterium]|nr:outer membrane beta-barrel protein [Gammaproteobacteria bacterium]
NPPVAEDGTLTTEVNTAKDGTLVATDPDGDPLTFSIVSQPSHGGVTLDDASTGAYTYTPDTGYSGNDSFTFKASDGVADSNTATIAITVNAAPPPTPPKPPLCNGGCGGFGWLALAGLLGLILVPRYRRKRRDGGRTGAAFKRQAGKATAVLLCALPLTALAAPPGIWTGPYVGARAGVNFGSSDSFDTERAFTFGVEAGYDFQLSPHFVLGGDAFYEWNQDMDHGYCAQGNCQTVSIGSNVYGVEARFGFPVGVSGRFMPYLKLGYARVNFTGDANQCDNGWRYGVGLAFFVGSGNAFSLNVQYSYQKLGSDSDDWSNGNLTLGLSYRF